MTSRKEGPPRSGWARLVPELLVQDLTASLIFWRDLLGFRAAYARPEQGFVYLEHASGAQIMLCERSGKWETGPLEPPFGRGVMFQIYLDGIEPVLSALQAAHWPLHTPQRDIWRKVGTVEAGQREFFVQDPDGYLIMLAESLGERPMATRGAATV
ncbi:MAG: bleomycin resistance protein [Ferrovibrio sp.]|uniref:bleomycin resistance protein n=1 Tax=Ferrovibrio sp. TaxID=1917215 RepID=UPI00391D3BF1